MIFFYAMPHHSESMGKAEPIVFLIDGSGFGFTALIMFIMLAAYMIARD